METVLKIAFPPSKTRQGKKLPFSVMEYLQASLQHVPYVISSIEKEDKK